MGQRMLMREGKMGHRIEIQIAFEYIYTSLFLFSLHFIYVKREKEKD